MNSWYIKQFAKQVKCPRCGNVTYRNKKHLKERLKCRACGKRFKGKKNLLEA